MGTRKPKHANVSNWKDDVISLERTARIFLNILRFGFLATEYSDCLASIDRISRQHAKEPILSAGVEHLRLEQALSFQRDFPIKYKHGKLSP